MHAKHIALGTGILTLTSWIHKDLLDQEYVAHLGIIRLGQGGIGFQAEFNLGLPESQNLIEALQQHIKNIEQATAALAVIQQQEAA
ncbi:hypothetical protein [Methylophilus sp. Leaf414]|uniref:hypothetical protein n=1 Tax=Methylophilus sp. Leaf414 TaxID=1736371 RepID=UPI0006F6153F|nr:hypothetical protein [Methylophilus sp. Leaf414]KQT37702.1 hypothetical protein ASG24_01515 [Methylophilus sp. Leaf414]